MGKEDAMQREQVDAKLEQLEQGELRHRDLLDLFEELTFREKWRRVFTGLRMPPESGPHKFAKLQLLRLLSPLSAVVVPLLMFALIALFAGMTPPPERTLTVEIMDPEPMEELEPIEPPDIEPPEPPDPVDVDFTPDPTLPPAEVASPPVEYSPQPVEFDSVAITRSPVIMRGIYGSRSPGARGRAIAQFSGEGTQGAVLRALRWLKHNQREDGSWGQNRTAMTSLALLSFLAHGETPASDEFGYTVEQAIAFLIDAQRDDGRFRHADGHDYTTPIAAYALSEAFAITRVPMIRYAAEKAIAVVVKGQNKWGGFNYNLRGPEDERNDTSYFAWCIQALKAARMADLYVEGLDEAMQRAVDGVKRNYRDLNGYGAFGYTSPGVRGLTSAGVLSLQFLDRFQDRETLNAINWLNQNSVVAWHGEQIDRTHRRDPLYYWYYTTQVMFQHGGAAWENWNAQFAGTLVDNQQVIPADESGYVDHEGNPRSIGFWEAIPETNPLGAGNYPSYSTMLGTLMLTVYYRYLPTFRPPDEIEEPRGLDDDDDILINIVSSPAGPGSAAAPARAPGRS